MRGVSKEPPRETWKIWAEGKAPDLIIELSSQRTWEKDVQTKWQLYQQLGVVEYYIFDPWYRYLARPLLAYRLEGASI